MKRVLSLGAVGALALSGIVIGATPALAAEFEVTNGDDSGPGSLREALAQADANPGEDVIRVAEGLEIRPTAILKSNDAVRIVGEGAGATIFAAEVVDDPSAPYDNYLIDATGSIAFEKMTLDLNRQDQIRGALQWWSQEGDFLFEQSQIVGSPYSDAIWIETRDKPSSIRVIDSSFEGVRSPMNIYSGANGIFEISGSTFTGLHVLWQSKGAEIEAGQQVLVKNNLFEFSNDADLAYGGIQLDFQIKSADFSESPILLTGNHIVDRATQGSAVRVGAYHYDSLQLNVPAVTIENNSFERTTFSDQSVPMIEISGSDYSLRGETLITNSTFVIAGDWPAIEIHKSMSDADLVTVQHATVLGQIVTESGQQLAVQNSALTADSKEAVEAKDNTPVSGEGNVVTLAMPALPGATVVPDLGLAKMREDGLGRSWVRIPEEGSPLMNAAVPSDVSTDQRGIARPQGSAPDAGAVEVREAVFSIGNAGDVNAGDIARFPITVEAPGEHDVTIAVTTAGGTAIDGTDYTQTTQSLTFVAGATETQFFEVPTLAGAKTANATFHAVATVTAGTATLSTDTGSAQLLVKAGPKPEPVVDPETNGTKKPLPNTGYEANANIWLLGGGLLLASLVLALARRRFAK